MTIVIVVLVAFVASLLTLISGFGLGTIMLPVFAVFFPIEIAVAMTAIVHLANNLFKFGMMRRYIDAKTVLWFGIPGILGAFLGASLLNNLAHMPTVLFFSTATSPIKLIIGFLMLFFAVSELIPSLLNFQFKKKYLALGGTISGFFGGLSGHQGALRSMFLIKANLSKEAFVATGIAIALLVDLTRLPVYFFANHFIFSQSQWQIMILATISAIFGALLGKKLIAKVTLRAVQIIVGIGLIAMSILLIFNFI